jgi:predicted hydrocarbon binding protein
MHGIIFVELQRFVERDLGPTAWHRVVKAANLGNRVFTSVSDYPDRELFTLVEAASKVTGKSAAEILEAFGTFIAPDLLRMYAVLIKPDWKTLDVIENTEAVIHAVVRLNQPGAKPPVLKTTRIAQEEIELRYESPRKLCQLARGIMKGIAARYDDNIVIDERTCMLRGARACVIRVRTKL